MNDPLTADQRVSRYPFKDFLGRFVDQPDQCPIFGILAELPAASADGPWVAGGAIRRTLLSDPLESDVDFFFKSAEQKKVFHEAMLAKSGWLLSENQHATTFGIKIDNKTVIVQAVTIAYYESIAAVLDSFDFTITQFGYDGAELVCGEFALWDLARKRLALHKLTYGVSTVRRLIKYTRQGFTACSGALASILEQTVANPEVINREVTYVD